MTDVTTIDTKLVRRPVAPTARWAASAQAVAPSYIDAFATSMPVSSQIIDWYSKMTWSVPWDTSG